MPKVSLKVAMTVAALLFSLSLNSCRVAKDRQMEGDPLVSKTPSLKRAAFDLGSSTTKLRVAEVKVVDLGVETGNELTGGNEARRVNYESDLENSSESRFSEEIQERGIRAVRELKKYAEELGARDFVGVATGAFNRAKNASSYLQRMRRETGVKVHIASADEEDRLNFLAVLHEWKFVTDKLVLWDVGADGASLTYMDSKGGMQTFRSALASVVLRDRVIRYIQAKSARVTTPNPMSRQDVEATKRLVITELLDDVPRDLIEKIKEGCEVVGVGAVHNLSILGQSGRGYTYSKDDVREALERAIGKTDEQIGGEYADTQVVNLVLVLGYLEALGIDEVKTVHVNVADGMLRDGRYWDKNGR